MLEVSFDPCLKGLSFPSFLDTDEKNVVFLLPVAISETGGISAFTPFPGTFCMSTK
ncbi:hypothetical protein HPP92_027309 [Vanilla planifolia]|uniref:Uncharacterized protein n=1 Tax=Vanilla planifolia TaxID=51239 RepID=A0A835P9L2_VANPL|nr:hypothetical protein HPP92_027309 [Vanilla planifolia]